MSSTEKLSNEKVWEILLIDDDSTCFELIQAILNSGNIKQRYNINYAASVKDAFAYLLDHKPDLIFLDLILDDFSGIETFDIIFNHVPMIPIIVMTGNTDPKLPLFYKSKGAFDFITKNKINSELLKKVFERVVNLKLKVDLDFEEVIATKVNSKYVRPKILVVDDREENIVAMKSLLKKVDADIITAFSGHEALAVTLKEKLALILMDVQMPGMDGFETVGLMRAHDETRDIPVLFITAISKDKPDVAKGYNVGAVDYIFKPVDADILLSKVNVFLALYKNENEKRVLISELKESQSKIEEQREKFKFMAMHDSLTMLPNRLLFEKKTKNLIDYNRRYKHDFALMLFDLDKFKWINDAHGHDAGDYVLRFFANKLKSNLRKGDVVARLGGDEFGVLLPEVKPNSAAAVAEKFIATLHDEPCKFKDKVIKLTASIGITNSFDSGSPEYDSIFKRADIALYKAKEGGRDRFDFFSDDLYEIYLYNKELTESLKEALNRDEFVLEYQPVVDLVTGRIVGSEALLRWNNDSLGMQTPGTFLSIIEENRQIHNVGLWIIENMCKNISEHFDTIGNSDLFFTVNLSSVQFERDDFAKDVIEIIEKYRIPRELFYFELKENVVPKVTETYNRNLKHFVESGLKLAMDNFGTRIGSAAYFTQVNFGIIKVSSSILSDIANDTKKGGILRNLVKFAEGISVMLIAEKVENESQVEFLKANGCRMAQGFYFYKPMSFEELVNDI